MNEAKQFKRGDERSDGKLFWSYRRDLKSGEYWVTAEQFSLKKRQLAASWSKYAATEKGVANVRKKESNPKRIAQKKRLRESPKYKEFYKQYRQKESYKEKRRLNNAIEAKCPKRKEYHRQWKRQKRASDPMYRLSGIMRCRLYAATKMKGWGKHGSAAKAIGCSFQEMMDHIARQFKEGMDWSNHGKWEIDHITPLASANTPEELLELCHYTNLQPLWKTENRRKWAKVA
jgi:hypothetical protein